MIKVLFFILKMGKDFVFKIKFIWLIWGEMNILLYIVGNKLIGKIFFRVVF